MYTASIGNMWTILWHWMLEVDHCLLMTARGCFFKLDPDLCFLASLRVLTGSFDMLGVHLVEGIVFSLLFGGLEHKLTASSDIKEVLLTSV